MRLCARAVDFSDIFVRLSMVTQPCVHCLSGLIVARAAEHLMNLFGENNLLSTEVDDFGETREVGGGWDLSSQFG